MRCTYMSDLHLEAQEFGHSLLPGDILILAGDLCNAKYIDPERKDKYSINHRNRVMKFIKEAKKKFNHVIFIAGNHEHYEFIDIDGVRFFGSTLWSDFQGRSQDCMNSIRRRIGEFLLVKKRIFDQNCEPVLTKFQPEDALVQFDEACDALQSFRQDGFKGPAVVITHHAPSLKGLNPHFERNEMDGAFASDLTPFIEALENVPFWIHGHTHIRKKYKIGSTQILANCLGYVDKDPTSKEFRTDRFFEVK